MSYKFILPYDTRKDDRFEPEALFIRKQRKNDKRQYVINTVR